MTDDSNPTFDPRSIAGTKHGELIADKLAQGEAVRCWFTGMEEPNGCLLMIPVIGTFLEFKKRFYVVVLTDRRLLLVEIAKPFMTMKEKAATECSLTELSSVRVEKGVLLSTVTLGVPGREALVLKSVDPDAARLFDSLVAEGAGG